MKITPREALKLNLWDKVCELTGIDVYAIKEGQIDKDEVINIEVKD